jgi:hypothetical protein
MTNIAMERSTMLLISKSSISMDHVPWRTVSHNQRVFNFVAIDWDTHHFERTFFLFEGDLRFAVEPETPKRTQGLTVWGLENEPYRIGNDDRFTTFTRSGKSKTGFP